MLSILKLKQLLTKSDKLDKVWNYFFDLMDRKILLKGSQTIADPSQDDTLLMVLEAVKNSANWQLGEEISVVGLMFAKTPSEHFYQGICTIQNLFPPAVFFYFSDIEMGALTYSKSGQNEMFRFSLTKVTDPKMLTRH